MPRDRVSKKEEKAHVGRFRHEMWSETGGSGGWLLRTFLGVQNTLRWSSDSEVLYGYLSSTFLVGSKWPVSAAQRAALAPALRT